MKSKILIIEDAPVIRVELIALLNGIDYEASAVTDFSATIQTMKSVQPHLILLDIELPQTNGFTLLKRAYPAEAQTGLAM